MVVLQNSAESIIKTNLIQIYYTKLGNNNYSNDILILTNVNKIYRTREEDELLNKLQELHGNSWKHLATLIKVTILLIHAILIIIIILLLLLLQGRSENDIKNRWNNRKRISNTSVLYQPQAKSNEINSRKMKRGNEDDESLIIVTASNKKLKVDTTNHINILGLQKNEPDDSDSEDDNELLTSFRKKFVSFQKNNSIININSITPNSNITVNIGTTVDNKSNNTDNDATNTSSIDDSFTNRYSDTYKETGLDIISGLASGFSSLTNSGRNSPTDLFDICNEFDDRNLSPSSNSSISLSFSCSSLSSLSFTNLMRGNDV